MEIKIYKCEFCGEDISSINVNRFGFDLIPADSEIYGSNVNKLSHNIVFQKANKHLCYNCTSVICKAFEENRLKTSYSKNVSMGPR
jgi:hypothetical protein